MQIQRKPIGERAFSRIFRTLFRSVLSFGLIHPMLTGAFAQQPPPTFSDLSIEQLLAIPVTSASRRQEQLLNTASNEVPLVANKDLAWETAGRPSGLRRNLGERNKLTVGSEYRGNSHCARMLSLDSTSQKMLAPCYQVEGSLDAVQTDSLWLLLEYLNPELT